VRLHAKPDDASILIIKGGPYPRPTAPSRTPRRVGHRATPLAIDDIFVEWILFLKIFLDRIYRIIRIFFVHHFPEESDEGQSAFGGTF
jgi:hypothetical protein